MNATPSHETWMRTALARCYYHSPLPWLLTPLRNRYRIQVSDDGGRRRIGWRKRSGPNVRIFFFHHINDNHDPFLPSTPTAVFEGQMRFIARHYTVVSLEEAVRRLREGGPPGPAIVITFDDGYQDNYSTAFPILQRYGLPATIFLATGSIDSQEPPWFEHLALAIKHTSRQHVDIDALSSPRIWLRDEAERLRANSEIYQFVRALPDGERRRWVSEIVSQLGGEGGRRDQMLSWDQIRLMHRSGIGFGGHTVSHPFVSRLEPAQAAWEFSTCKQRIEEEIQTPVKHFAYPSGRAQDIADWNKRAVAAAGYEAAVSTHWGMNDPATDRMELKRGGPWEHNPALFAVKLDWYQWADV
jgi:peptidoglycan/xylan/chitin deacetylase (PgdA/CDA1 family)